jgi:hypothetical protein
MEKAYARAKRAWLLPSQLTSLEYELDVFAYTIRLCLIAFNEMENGSNVCLNFLSCVFFSIFLVFFVAGWQQAGKHHTSMRKSSAKAVLRMYQKRFASIISAI